MFELAGRFKARRLAMNFWQEGLAKRAGVSWSWLKRFEYTGLVSLDSLLRLALVLGCLDDFERVCAEDGQDLSAKMLDELLVEPKRRRKGRIK